MQAALLIYVVGIYGNGKNEFDTYEAVPVVVVIASLFVVIVVVILPDTTPPVVVAVCRPTTPVQVAPTVVNQRVSYFLHEFWSV